MCQPEWLQDSIYKFFWVGILLADKWNEVIGVNRVNDRIIIIKFVVGQCVISVVSVWLR